MCHLQIDLKTRVFLDTGTHGDNRDLSHACLFEGTADETDIVGSTTAATGLCNDQGNLVKIIFAGQKCLHKLTDNDQGWIAGIVINIFQTVINRSRCAW